MTIVKPANADVPDEFKTTGEIVEDIRLRILYAPKIVGSDHRGLPPVDWDKVIADEAADDEWQQQFEDDVKNGKFGKS